MLRIRWTLQRCHDAPASTPWDRRFQPGMGVGDDQAHAAEAPVSQAAEERGPEHLVLGVADIDAEHLPIPVRGHAGGHDDSTGDDPMVDPGLDVGRVQIHVRHGEVIEPPVRNTATSSSIPAQIRDTVDFDTPDSHPSARTRSSTFRVEVPVV